MEALPTTRLSHVTLYKNDLAFVERSARCGDGALLDQSGQRGFKLDVPNENRELTMATCAVTAGDSAAVMVSHDTKAQKASSSAANPTHDFAVRMRMHATSRTLGLPCLTSLTHPRSGDGVDSWASRSGWAIFWPPYAQQHSSQLVPPLSPAPFLVHANRCARLPSASNSALLPVRAGDRRRGRACLC